MLKAEMVAAFEDKLPVKVMDNQDDTWNILLKIKRQQFFGNGAAVCEGHVGEVLVSIGEQVKVNSPSACLWVLEQHDDQQADEAEPVRNWDLKHNPKRSKIQFTKEEQKQMECNRLSLLLACTKIEDRNSLPPFCLDAGLTNEAKQEFAVANNALPDDQKKKSVFDMDFDWLFLANTP